MWTDAHLIACQRDTSNELDNLKEQGDVLFVQVAREPGTMISQTTTDLDPGSCSRAVCAVAKVVAVAKHLHTANDGCC